MITCDGNGGGVWYSTNLGVSWTEANSNGIPSNHTWNSVAISSDGTSMIAGDIAGGVWYSTNSGVSWTEATSIPTTYQWSSVAITTVAITKTSTNTIMLACNQGDPNKGSTNGGVWYSTNSGGTWTEAAELPLNHTWNSVAISSDGTSMITCDGNGGGVWYSTNSGESWTEANSNGIPTNNVWNSVAISSSGSMIAGDLTSPSGGGGIWYSFQIAPCFLSISKILLANSTYKSIDLLSTFDKVKSPFSSEPQAIRNIIKRPINSSTVPPDNMPVCIEKDFISKGVPFEDVYISGYHRVVLSDKSGPNRHIGVQANKLTNKFITLEEVNDLFYYHIELEDPTQHLIVSGMPVESFQKE